MDDERTQHGEVPAPAERLRARAEATDRASRFDQRLAEVERARAQRRRVRTLLRIGWVVLFAGIGALVPLVVAAVLAASDPTGGTLLAGAGVGALVGALGPVARDRLARRRGSRAWDAYRERYVLFGNPSAHVHDADRPADSSGGAPRPTRSPPRPTEPTEQTESTDRPREASPPRSTESPRDPGTPPSG